MDFSHHARLEIRRATNDKHAAAPLNVVPIEDCFSPSADTVVKMSKAQMVPNI